MSDSQAYEEVAISSDGVTVIKRFEEDEFPVPAIAFEFSSEREEEVSVRLTDEVPDGVEVEDLGFHPEYGSEYWTIDDDHITFEKDLEADGEYTTVYGIRATGADDVEQFLTEPVIDAVEPPLPEDEQTDTSMSDGIIPESDDDVVRDVISGEGDVPGLESDDETEDEDGEEIETLDLKDPNSSDDGQTTVSTESMNGDAETEADNVAVNGSVVSAMANEIRQNNVSVDDLKLLQRAIDKLSDKDESATSSNGATDARIERLQADIADLRAYTDALEEFLDENGTGDQLIADFESQLEQFDADLDRLEADMSEATDTVDRIDDEMEEVESEVDSVGSDVDEVESTVSEMEDTLENLESSVSQLEEEVENRKVADRMDEVENEVSELREWQEQIRSTFGG